MKHSGNAASLAGHLPLVIFIQAKASSSSYPAKQSHAPNKQVCLLPASFR
jgi:hypothetical protein